MQEIENLELNKRLTFLNIDRKNKFLENLDSKVDDELVRDIWPNQTFERIYGERYNQEDQERLRKANIDLTEVLAGGGVAGTSIFIHEKNEIKNLLNSGKGITREHMKWTVHDLIMKFGYQVKRDAHLDSVNKELEYLQQMAEQQNFKLSREALLLANPMFYAAEIDYLDDIRDSFSAHSTRFSDFEEIFKNKPSDEEIDQALDFYQQNGFPSKLSREEIKDLIFRHFKKPNR
jgi:hypothetical protein